jgi:predicted nucleic acid-binding protein
VSPSVVVDAEQEMRALSQLVLPRVRLAVVTAKESDNRVLECAVEGQADVIVTGDRKHLLPLGSYAGIPIITPRDFLTSIP